MKRVILTKNNVTISRAEKDSKELIEKGWKVVTPEVEAKKAEKTEKAESKGKK